MRVIGKLLLGSVAIAACLGMAAVPALAESPEWAECVSSTEGVFENNECAKEKAEGGWEWKELGKSDTVKLAVLTLRLRDTKTLAGEAEIECSSNEKDEGEGTISSPNTGQVTKVKINSAEVNKRCTRLKGGCEAGKIEEVKGVNLPWNIELIENEHRIITKIANSGAGEPGWEIKCHTLLGSKTDECMSVNKEYEESELLNEDGTAASVVLGIFKKAHKSKCTEGGAESGETEGEMKTQDAATGVGIRSTINFKKVNNGGSKTETEKSGKLPVEVTFATFFITPSVFTIANPATPCEGKTYKAGAECEFSETYKPAMAGEKRRGLLVAPFRETKGMQRDFQELNRLLGES